MPNYREAILSAVMEADRLHKQFDTRPRAELGEGRIDVFGMFVSRDIPIMFRPLKSLLGAYIDDPAQGVMVTSQRSLPVQRFTAAHELGHAVLGHEASLDKEEILTRALFVLDSTFDLREIQANAFASQLLTPPWLIVQHMKRQGWTRESLADPIVAYQLALRMGSSYSATCYALAQCRAIDEVTLENLLGVQPKTIKQRLAEPYEPANWYGDVWLITERDDGTFIEGSRSDLVVLKFQENTTAGYMWQFAELTDAGFEIVEDAHQDGGYPENFGGIVFRRVIAQAKGSTRGHFNVREIRPWQSDSEPLHSLEFDTDLSGPVPAGLIHSQRQELLDVA